MSVLWTEETNLKIYEALYYRLLQENRQKYKAVLGLDDIAN